MKAYETIQNYNKSPGNMITHGPEAPFITFRNQFMPIDEQDESKGEDIYIQGDNLKGADNSQVDDSLQNTSYDDAQDEGKPFTPNNRPKILLTNSQGSEDRINELVLENVV